MWDFFFHSLTELNKKNISLESYRGIPHIPSSLARAARLVSRQVKSRQLGAGKGFTVEVPPYFGGQRGPNIPTKIKVCGEPSWIVRESVCQIRVQTDERFRRLSHTNPQTNPQTHIQLRVYII